MDICGLFLCRDPSTTALRAYAQDDNAQMTWQWEMRDFGIVTYSVDPDRLAALLPHSFEPDVFTLDSGRECAFVSAVPFRVASLTIGGGWIPLGFVQVNYRAYIRRHGERCVWFFGSSVSSRIVIVPRLLYGLPWYFTESSMDAAWVDGAGSAYTLRNSGTWGGADLECSGSGKAVGRLDGFADLHETRAVLTAPLSGFCLRRDGALLEIRVKHEPLPAQTATARTARFPVFEDLNLCASESVPHSVLLLESTTFDVLPPRLAKSSVKRKRPV
jgi:uncharacterized protein YqjF (DUF2071 family)